MEREVRFSLAGVNERSSPIGGYLSCYLADVGPGFDGKERKIFIGWRK
jgi:hypothetical protein